MSLSLKSFARTLAVVASLAVPATIMAPEMASAQVSLGISVNFGPPPLPVYVQPELPAPGYVWVPGYWAWDDASADYYWVPGYWSQPPEVNVYWTPGYWGWNDGSYVFNGGYWGPTVGFYGGINYGFGYNGDGFFGGHWGPGNVYQYNSSVTNVTNINTTNIYNQPVAGGTSGHTSFNGGKGGTEAKPTPEQIAAGKEKHIAPTAGQINHEHSAQALPSSHFSANNGKPAVAAVAKPGEFKGAGVVPAKASGGVAPKPALGTAPKPGAGGGAPKPGASGAPKPSMAPKSEAAPVKPKPEVNKPERAAPKPERAAPKVEQRHEQPRPAAAPRPQPQPHPAAPPRPAPPRPAPHPAPAPHPQQKCPKPQCH